MDQPFIFCLVPEDRASVLLAALRRHYADQPSIAVLVERRADDDDPQGRPAQADEHRHRAPVAQRDLVRSLPPDIAGEAASLRFVQRMDALGSRHQHTDMPLLIASIRNGDSQAASELWWRVHERVRLRLHARLDTVEAARAGSRALGRILDGLDGYEEDPELPFAAWLDDLIDRYAAEQRSAAAASPDGRHRAGTRP